MPPPTILLLATCGAAFLAAVGLLLRGALYRPARPLSLVVAERIDHSPELFSLTLRRPRRERFLPLPRFVAGQSVALAIPGEPTKRRYSLARWQARPYAYALTIKREAQGRFSPRLAEHARPGARLVVGRPQGRFALAPQTAARRAVFIAGGVGITPLLAMLDAWAATDRSYGETHLYWQVRHDHEACHLDALAALAGRRSNFRLRLLVSQPAAGTGERLTTALLADELGAFGETDFYVCAGQGLMDSVLAGLAAAGVGPDAVHFERFGLGRSAGTHGDEWTVTYGGARFPFAGHASLLDAIEAQDLPIAADCRTGCCGRCLVVVEEGEAAHRVAPEHPVPDGHVLACCAVPGSDLRLGAAVAA